MRDQNTEVHELEGKSPEFRTELAKQIEELVPEAVADGKVDVAKLKELLADDAGDTDERFGLFWPGKKRAMRAAQDGTTATLKPAPEFSKDWDTTENVFIEGDNLEVLKVLQRQYHNKIKMIYIDPPYNTGKDFVYPDNFKEGLQNYLEFSKQVDEGNKKISTNTETTGRYHSNWLNMMYPRLKLARNLLTDDGVIFISIDDNEQPQLRKICDEVFGENNFVADFIWTKKEKASGVPPVNMILPNKEHVLCYQRSNDVKFAGQERSMKSYKQDQNGRWWRLMPIQATGVQDSRFNIIDPTTGTSYFGNWAFSENTIKQMVDQGKIAFPKGGKGLPTQIVYADEMKNDTSPVFEYIGLHESEVSSKAMIRLMDGKVFDFPKPVTLLIFFMSQVTGEDDIILDFFSGSGTTAHAVMQLNAEDGGSRKHIQVQLPEPTDEKSEAYKAGYRKISDIARERINRAGDKIKADFADKLTQRETPLDIGYRTYKLADTNFRKWQSNATADLGEVQARLDLMRESSNDDASEVDLLTEVMLKMGLPLTTHIATREVAGLTVYQAVPEGVGEGDDEEVDVQPAFYMNEHVKPTLEQLRTIVTELSPSKFVILEDAFQGDNELKTNLVQTCKSYDVELWTV